MTTQDLTRALKISAAVLSLAVLAGVLAYYGYDIGYFLGRQMAR